MYNYMYNICSDCATWGNLGMYMYPVIHTLHSVLKNKNKKLTLQFVLRSMSNNV